MACRWCGLVLGSGVGRTEKKFMSICIFPQLKEVFIQQSVQGVTSMASVRRGPQQARVCTFPPGHEAPPFWGAGLLHSLLLSWVPALQADQELQQLQRPSALAPAQIISQGRRRLAYKKQLGLSGGQPNPLPWSGRQSLLREMPGTASPDLCFRHLTLNLKLWIE